MTENELSERLSKTTDKRSALAVALEFIKTGEATTVETIALLRGVLEDAYVPKYDGPSSGYEKWYEAHGQEADAGLRKVQKLLLKQGQNVVDNENLPIEELQTLYELCFDDVLYAMCNGPEDEAEARDMVWEAFNTGVAINAYANQEGVSQ